VTADFTVKDVVNVIRQVVPNLAVSFVESPIMNQLSYEVDDSKIRRIGYSPAGTLLEGIREMIAHLEGFRWLTAVRMCSE